MRPVLTDHKGHCSDEHTRKTGLEFRRWPSRRGNTLYYRDGRAEPATHALQPVNQPTKRRI